jgi:hypothetical protein
MDHKETKQPKLETPYRVAQAKAESESGDDRSLDSIPKVNVIGGYQQKHPVKFVLADRDEAGINELNTNTTNTWHLLKNRPSIISQLNQMISLTALKGESDVTRLMDRLKKEPEFSTMSPYLFASAGITGTFNTAAEFYKNQDAVKKLEAYLHEQVRYNLSNQRADYARVKKITRALVSRNLAGHSGTFDELERVLDASHLDYIENMYAALGLTYSADMPITMVELIWSYWMEEGMLAQSMYVISRRFQNIRNGDRDPLANFAIDPLRSAGDLLWGYIQDTPNRLTVQRRSYEYENHYGLRLFGPAIPRVASADSRSKFIGAFNNLLVKCGVYFRQTDNLTIQADAFPVLNALQELHLILAEGANNQYGNLPTESRIEMIVEQYILSRPEIREFLNSRVMVPYKEEWMGRVDALKKLQRWDPTGITNYYELATFGEMLLLSIRLISWSDINSSETAGMWAKYFRNEIQKYIFNYRAVTGVDLSSESSSTAEERNTIPGILIQRRMSKGG